MIGLANRSKFVEENQDTIFDLIVIGGGITGAGILLDSSSRGKKGGDWMPPCLQSQN